MKKIYKYMLKIQDEQLVEMPLPANVLSVQMQPNPLRPDQRAPVEVALAEIFGGDDDE